MSLTSRKGIILTTIGCIMMNTMGIVEVIVISSIPNHEDLPFPRADMLYIYTIKGTECAFNCFSGMLVFTGLGNKLKGPLRVSLIWNTISTALCGPLNLELFRRKVFDHPVKLIKAPPAPNATTTTPEPENVMEYFYVRLVLTLVILVAKVVVLYQYQRLYSSLDARE